MEEIDALIDSLLENRAAFPSYLDDRHAKKLAIEKVPGKGEGVFAKQRLSVDTPICSLGCPTMMAIDSNFLSTTCYRCLVVAQSPLPFPVGRGHAPDVELKTCNGCRRARFCSKNCQVEAWHAYHKFECKIFRDLGSFPPATFRAVLRTVLLKERDMVSAEEWNRIISLTSHEQILAARGRSNLTAMAESVIHLTRSNLSVGIVQKLIFIIRANAIELPSSMYGGIGVMLEPLVAKINHSCEPNVALHRPQHTMSSGNDFMTIVPLRDIQPGEELLNCYVAPTVSVRVRQAKLLEDYMFKCDCRKCRSDIQALAEFDRPDLSTDFRQWSAQVKRHLTRVRQDPRAFKKAAAAMNKTDKFIANNILVTTGDFPEIAMSLILEALNTQNLDEALVNALRMHFLINPDRFVGRHNPTNIYTMFVILDLLDALIGVVAIPRTSDGKVEKSIQTLSSRGLGNSELIYWRGRICEDLRRRIEASSLRDLLALVEKREKQAMHLVEQYRHVAVREDAERRMRVVLGLREDVWEVVL